MMGSLDINLNKAMEIYSRFSRPSGEHRTPQAYPGWPVLVWLFLWLTSTHQSHAEEAINHSPLQQETLFTYRAPESDRDTRLHYEIDVLRLALEKTEKEYGPFRLEPTPRINVARCLQSIQQHRFTNFFCSLGYNETYESNPDITYVRFPIEMGVLSYRTCFTNAKTAEKLKTITTIEQLRKLTHGQGRDWADVAVLRHNGFKVIEVDQYEALFTMTAAGRFDLFCRGTNEIKEEYDARHSIPGLVYDRNLLIYYSMPLFLYTNKSNTRSIERITKGLHTAYKDGSLVALWKKKHLPNADFAALNGRRVFRLENPLVKSIDFDYEKYNYKFLLPVPIK